VTRQLVWVALITIAYCLGVIVVSAGTSVAISMALGLATAPLFRAFLAFGERGKAKPVALVD
jgi:arginine:agmatine antiporter